MTYRADIAVFDKYGNLQLVVEVKAKTEASMDWITQLRRNLLVHSVIPATPFFLLALPDYVNLWSNTKNDGELAPPDYKIDAQEVLAPYYENSTVQLNDIIDLSVII